jgi:uncharacterized 2Fe-2S/4Fe-4S cluster protein (DUF4445 family)
MPGLPGAIESFAIGPDDTHSIAVIGGGQPAGICGSGLIDVLSELLRTGQMNALGRLENGESAFRLHGDGADAIRLGEADINELAQAKGANVAGLRVVFDEFGARFEDVDVFYLAGGFGRNLSVESAKRIGLIPNIESGRIRQVGNASVEGACLALLSKPKRQELERLVRRVTHCRLETHPQFFDYFVEGCQFNPVSSRADPQARFGREARSRTEE